MLTQNSSNPSPENWDKVAENYSLEIASDEEEIASELSVLISSLGLSSGSSLLEIGSGSGHLSGLLAKQGYKVSLLDFSSIALEKAKLFFDKHNLQGNFIQADLTNLSSSDIEYDLVWNSGVMEHFNSEALEKAFKSIKNISSRFFIFLVPNPLSLPYLMYRYKLMKEGNWIYGTEFLRTNYDEILVKSGFEIVDTIFLGMKSTENFVEYIFNSEEGSQCFAEMLSGRIIPENQAYLIAYLASETSSLEKIEPSDINKSPQIAPSISAESKTNHFDTFAELHREDSIIKEILTRQQQVQLQLQQLQGERDLAQSQLQLLQAEQDKTQSQLQLLQVERDWTNSTIAAMESSKFWKLRTQWFKLKHLLGLSINSDSSERSNAIILVNKGLIELTKKIARKIKTKINQSIEKLIKVIKSEEHFFQLQSIVKASNRSAKGIIIYPPTVDWNVPLFQRPQHLALHLARQGYLFLYCTKNAQWDNYEGFNLLEKGLYLNNRYDLVINKIPPNLERWLILASNHASFSLTDLLAIKEKGIKIIYEYIDEINPEIAGADVINFIAKRHESLNNRLIDVVLASATKLHEEMLNKFPKEKVFYLPNAVDYNHFHINRNLDICPEDMKLIVSEEKPIIGYYGALAKWIDYKLISFIAENEPHWNIVLIGWDYDNSMQALAPRTNIKYLGIKPYEILPQYGIWFDVAIIPFKEGDVAKSTSPLKLFEYMAMNKPVVATKDLIECTKYEGVFIAETENLFINKVKQALQIKDKPAYQKLLDSQARANTWEKRAVEIDKIIQNFHP